MLEFSCKMQFLCFIFFFSLFSAFLKFVQFSLLGMLCARNLYLLRCFGNSVISSCFIHGAGGLVNYYFNFWLSMMSLIKKKIKDWTSRLLTTPPPLTSHSVLFLSYPPPQTSLKVDVISVSPLILIHEISVSIKCCFLPISSQ